MTRRRKKVSTIRAYGRCWAAASLFAAGPAAAGELRPPVTPACISSPFGWRHAVGPHAQAGFHNGIDLPAPAGALVHAAADGTIQVIKRQGLGGVTVHIAHGGGLVTLYAHLGNLVPAIAEGKRRVVAGEPLGHVARTGVTYGTHVFFAVLRDGQAVDPAPLLGVGPCRP
jgi:murein DD-endopeptidase MepM/ murein hydrolase activator NlpD